MSAAAKEQRHKSRWRCRAVLLTALLFFVLSINAGSQEPKPAKPLTPEQQEKLQERDRLDAGVVKLLQANKVAEAIAAKEKAVALHREALGNDDPGLVNQLERLAFLQEIVDNLAATRKVRQELLDIEVKRHGAGHWQAIDARLALSHLDRLEKLSEADRRQLFNARAWHARAADLYRQGKMVEAVALAEKEVALRQRLLGDKDADYVASISNLGTIYQDKGELAKAEKLHREALETRREILGDKHPQYAANLHDLARLYVAQSDFAKAEAFARQALELDKQLLGEKHPHYALVLTTLGNLYVQLGDSASAETLIRQALDIYKQTVGDRDTRYVNALNSLGMVYQSRGDYLRAEPLFRQLADTYKQVRGEKHPLYATGLNNLGDVHRASGDYFKAEACFRQAADIYKQAHGEGSPNHALSLNNLAVTYHLQGEYAKAEELFREVLRLRKQILGDKHPDFAISLSNLAEVYRELGDYAKAEPLLQQALQICKERLGEKSFAYTHGLHNLGLLYGIQGDYARAEPLQRQALELSKVTLGEKHPLVAVNLSNLAQHRLRQGDPGQAEVLFGQAMNIGRENLDLAAAAQSERQQLRMMGMSRHFLDYYLSVTRAAKVSGSKAYGPVLSWKGAVTARQQRLRLERRDPQLAAELRSVSGRLAALAFATPDAQQRPAYQQKMLELAERKEKVEQELARKSAASRADLVRLSPEQLQQALPAGTVLVDLLDYVHATADPKDIRGRLAFQRRLVAFVVPSTRDLGKKEVEGKGADIVQLDLGPVGPLAEAIEKWRQSVGTRTRPLENDDDPAALLRQRLWLPLEPYVKDARMVFVSPDGVVAGLPLAALPGSRPGAFLMEEATLVVAPVPQLLPALLTDPPAAAKESLLLVGDVDYGADNTVLDARSSTSREAAMPAGQREKVSWPRLPASNTEVLAIRDLFRRHAADGAVTLLKGGQASEAAVRQEAARHRYLHLATHGFFADPRLRSALIPEEKALLDSGQFGPEGFIGFHPGLLSGLVLAGANRPVQSDRDDGILTALEVAELDLQNVQLAVLSACESGLGAAAGGEGVLGLQRAFQVAGARNVVTSLWKVDDDATAALMALFYHKLWVEKKAPMLALREAQLTLRHHPERIVTLARERGPDFDKVVRLPATPSKETKPGTNAAVKLWAAFVLSGTGK